MESRAVVASTLARSCVVALVSAVLLSGCSPPASNPTPDAVPFAFGTGWLRHLKDRHGRDATVVAGFTLVDRAGRAVAADGRLEVELEWRVGLLEWTLEGEVEIDAASFRQCKGRPVADGTWCIEPWSAYLIGAQSPGASVDGYETTMTFFTEDGRRFQFYRRLRPVSVPESDGSS